MNHSESVAICFYTILEFIVVSIISVIAILFISFVVAVVVVVVVVATCLVCSFVRCSVIDRHCITQEKITNRTLPWFS